VKRTEMVLAAVVVAVSLMLFAARFVARQPTQGNMHGTTAPDFALQALEGRTVKLSDYRGKAVLLNFWATWCQPCKIEMSWFTELDKQYGPQGLVIIGVTMDDASPEEISTFAKKVGVHYTIVLGKEKTGEDFGGVPFLPATFYIDRDGKIVERVFGLKSRSEIEDNIKRALAQGNAAQARK